jgi:hypothetical protein
LKLVEGAATHWHSADDQIEWQFLIRKPGIFRVIVTYAADAASAGGNARLAMSGYSQPTPPEVTMPIRNTGGSAAFVSDPVTRMFRIDKAGRYTLTIAAAQKPADQLMTLRRVRLHRMPVR